MCSECLRGFYPVAGTCHQCPKVSFVGAIIGLLIMALLFFLVQRGTLDDQALRMLRDIATYCQFLTINFSIAVPWPAFFVGISHWTRFLNIDLELFSPHCVTNVSWHAKFWMIMTGAMVVFGGLAAASAVVARLAGRQEAADRNARKSQVMSPVPGAANAANTPTSPREVELAAVANNRDAPRRQSGVMEWQAPQALLFDVINPLNRDRHGHAAAPAGGKAGQQGGGSEPQAVVTPASPSSPASRNPKPHGAQRLRTLQQRLYGLIVTLAVLAYVPLLRTVAEAFACSNTTSGRVLRPDTAVRCGSGVHVAHMLLCAIMALLLAVVLPVYLLWRIRRLRRLGQMRTSMEGTLLLALYEPYANHFPYMEVGILLRKAATVAVAVMVTAAGWQAGLLLAITLPYFVVVAWQRPWEVLDLKICGWTVPDALNNSAIAAALMHLLSLVAAGAVLLVPGSSDAVSLVAAGASGVLTAVFVFAWLQFMCRRKTVGVVVRIHSNDSAAATPGNALEPGSPSTQQLTGAMNLELLLASVWKRADAGDGVAATAAAQAARRAIQQRLVELKRREKDLLRTMRAVGIDDVQGLVAAREELNAIRSELGPLEVTLVEPDTRAQLKRARDKQLATSLAALQAGMEARSEEVMALLRVAHTTWAGLVSELEEMEQRLRGGVWVQECLAVRRELGKAQQTLAQLAEPNAAQAEQLRQWEAELQAASKELAAQRAAVEQAAGTQGSEGNEVVQTAKRHVEMAGRALAMWRQRADAAAASKNYWAMDMLLTQRKELPALQAQAADTSDASVPDTSALARELNELRGRALALMSSVKAEEQEQAPAMLLAAQERRSVFVRECNMAAVRLVLAHKYAAAGLCLQRAEEAQQLK